MHRWILKFKLYIDGVNDDNGTLYHIKHKVEYKLKAHTFAQAEQQTKKIVKEIKKAICQKNKKFFEKFIKEQIVFDEIISFSNLKIVKNLQYKLSPIPKK
jgi:hypothetical protein